jgi:hypothetical protein
MYLWVDPLFLGKDAVHAVCLLILDVTYFTIELETFWPDDDSDKRDSWFGGKFKFDNS